MYRYTVYVAHYKLPQAIAPKKCVQTQFSGQENRSRPPNEARQALSPIGEDATGAMAIVSYPSSQWLMVVYDGLSWCMMVYDG